MQRWCSWQRRGSVKVLIPLITRCFSYTYLGQKQQTNHESLEFLTISILAGCYPVMASNATSLSMQYRFMMLYGLCLCWHDGIYCIFISMLQRFLVLMIDISPHFWQTHTHTYIYINIYIYMLTEMKLSLPVHHSGTTQLSYMMFWRRDAKLFGARKM